ncbi:hypothetical protein [Campylobacter sp.]|nr:hypothetical protein [Campylobacter sp.]
MFKSLILNDIFSKSRIPRYQWLIFINNTLNINLYLRNSRFLP